MQSTFIMGWQQYQDEICTHVEEKMECVKVIVKIMDRIEQWMNE